MERYPGIFVSKVSTEEWEPDPEVGGEMHVLCAGLEVEAGLSRFPPGGGPPIWWTLPARETLLVLEGHGRIEIAGRTDARPGCRRHGVAPQGSRNDLAPHHPVQGVLGPRGETSGHLRSRSPSAPT